MPLALVRRLALLAVLLAGLVALADGWARLQLDRAVDGFAGERPGAAVRVAGASD